MTRSLVCIIGHSMRMIDAFLVDVALIPAPSSTKNQQHARNPKKHQTKKENPWYFGLKAHQHQQGLGPGTHAGNDISQTSVLLYVQKQDVWLDAGYVGIKKKKRKDMQAALAANGQASPNCRPPQ